MSISDTRDAKRYASIAEVAAAQCALYTEEARKAPDYTNAAKEYAEIAKTSAETAADSAQESLNSANGASSSAVDAQESANDAFQSAQEAVAAVTGTLRVPEVNIPSLPDSSNRSGLAIRFDNDGNPIMYDPDQLRTALASNAAGKGAWLSAYKSRTVAERLAEKVSILDYGAKPTAAYSDTMQNDLNAWNAAQAGAGSNGIVYFPAMPGWAETHYWIGGGVVYFHNCFSSSDPGVIIHLAEVSNNVAHPRRNLTPLTISRKYPGGSLDYGFELGTTKPIDAYMGIPSAIWSAMESGKQVRERVSLTTFDPIRISSFASAAYTEDGTGMASEASTSITWSDPTAAGSDHQGIMKKRPTAGITYEYLLDIPNTNSVSGVFDVVLGRAATTHRWVFTLGDSTIRFYNGDTLASSFTVLNLMDRIASDIGCVRVAVRMLQSNAAELVINDYVYDTQAVASPIRWLAFTVDSSARPYAKLKYANQSDRPAFASGRSLNVLCIGDSQTAGANASGTWPRLLEEIGQHLPGVGALKVTNMAISGTSSNYWATQINSIDCSPYDRVLIMLGVNDNQAAANHGLSPFSNNLVSIGAKVVADGSRPIWGMNTRYTSSDLSGNGGVTTNHGVFSRYNALLKDRCESSGWELADTVETFSNNAGLDGSFTGLISPSWHTDNIHPNERGHVAIAAAFAAALSRDVSRRYPVARLRSGSLSPAAPWIVHTPAIYGYLAWAIRDGVLYLRGKVRRDPSSPDDVANTIIATLPSSIPISAPVDLVVMTATADTTGFCNITITQNGNITAGPGALPNMLDLNVSFLL